jgi:hypothetical protein
MYMLNRVLLVIHQIMEKGNGANMEESKEGAAGAIEDHSELTKATFKARQPRRLQSCLSEKRIMVWYTTSSPGKGNSLFFLT